MKYEIRQLRLVQDWYYADVHKARSARPHILMEAEIEVKVETMRRLDSFCSQP